MCFIKRAISPLRLGVLPTFLACCVACFDFSPVRTGGSGEYCRDDRSCDGALQCSTKNRCTDACAPLQCAPLGLCDVSGARSACVCDRGEAGSGGNCVLPCESGMRDAAGDCIPLCSSTSHASTACSDGDVFWFDSCGEREEVASDCGARGCDAALCGDVRMAALADSLSGWSYKLMPFDVAMDGTPYVIGILPTYYYENLAYDLLRWTGDAWEQPDPRPRQVFPFGVIEATFLVDTQGALVLGVCEGLNTSECLLKIRKFDGVDFTTLGGVEIDGGAYGLDLIEYPPGQLAAAWERAADNKVTRWDGTSWSADLFPYHESSLSLAAYNGQLLAASSAGLGGDAAVRMQSGDRWTPLAGGTGGPESLLQSGFTPRRIRLTVAGSDPVAALLVEPIAGGVARIHMRRYEAAGWKRIGATLEPAPFEPTRAVKDLRVAGGSRGEVFLAYSQETESSGVALNLRMWRDGAWAALSYPGAPEGTLTDPSWMVTWFDLRAGGERVCLGWNVTIPSEGQQRNGFVCGWF